MRGKDSDGGGELAKLSLIASEADGGAVLTALEKAGGAARQPRTIWPPSSWRSLGRVARSSYGSKTMREVLNGPYEGLPTGSPSRRKFDGFGFGANRDSMAGVPHFDDATFIGRFPVAEIALHRNSFPGQVRVTAFSPFIPHNERDSSTPAALFAFEVENNTDSAIEYTIAGTLGNCGCDSGVDVFSRSGDLSSLHFTSAQVDRPPAQRGDLAITAWGDGVEHVDYHARGQWFDSLSRYWRQFARTGPLVERRYNQPRHRPDVATARARDAWTAYPRRAG